MHKETCVHACIKYTQHKLQLGLAQEAEQFAAQFPFYARAYMCIFVRNRCCSSIKLAAHAARPPQSLAGQEAAALCDLPVSRRGGCSPCIARAAPASLQTRVFPHLAAAVRDPVYLPPARCLLLFCTGLGSHFLLGFWKAEL